MGLKALEAVIRAQVMAQNEGLDTHAGRELETLTHEQVFLANAARQIFRNTLPFADCALAALKRLQHSRGGPQVVTTDAKEVASDTASNTRSR